MGNTDLLNTILIIVSFFLAIYIPFELFLFSYVVLGPLHYISEINWLNRKNYFVKKRKYVLILLILTVLISIPVILRLPIFDTFKLNNNLILTKSYFDFFLLITFLFSVGLLHIHKFKTILLYFLFCIIVGWLILHTIPLSSIIIGVFLPTLLHVYLFTLLFIWYGGLKSQNKTAFFNVFLLLAIPCILVFLNVAPLDNYLFDYTKNSFLSSGLSRVTQYISIFISKVTNQELDTNLLNSTNLKIQIFITFAYTYHYLNWFSKTSTIGWMDGMSRFKKLIILFFWIASIGLYLYDFKIGLVVLFFMSILHVILEFPLNIFTITEIFNKIRR